MDLEMLWVASSLFLRSWYIEKHSTPSTSVSSTGCDKICPLNSFLLVTDIRNKKNFHFFYRWNWNKFSPIPSQISQLSAWTLVGSTRFWEEVASVEKYLWWHKDVSSDWKKSTMNELLSNNRGDCEITLPKMKPEALAWTAKRNETKKDLLNFRSSSLLKRWVWDAAKLWINLY